MHEIFVKAGINREFRSYVLNRLNQTAGMGHFVGGIFDADDVIVLYRKL